MPVFTAVVPQEWEGRRIDVFLAAVGPLSRNAIERLIVENRVTCNGEILRKKDKAKTGQEITVDRPDPIPTDVRPENIPLDIIYEDSDLLVLNKQRGLCVHPSPGHDTGTLVSALLYHCGSSLSGIGGVLRPGIVHRLDKDTSGLMVTAKNDACHVALSAALKKREVARIYTALCRGAPKQDVFTVNAPLGRHKTDRKRQAVIPDGRAAVTHVEVTARYPGYSLLRCRLETGRTHQIRVHMQSVGHPLAGDTLYGGKTGELGLWGQCLHAGELAFTHPRSGEHMCFSSPLPDWFRAALDSLTNTNI